MRFAMSFSTVSFFLLALMLGAPPPARADGALEALVAKAREASGAPYRYHVVSTSHETDDRREYVVTTESQGLKYRARKCVGSLCTTGFYFDGERSFDTNFNDTAIPLSSGIDGLQLTLRAIASYAFTAPDFRANGGQIEARDAISRDGKMYGRIAVAPRFGSLLDAVIDPDSGLVVGVISDAKRLAFEFRDQRKVGNRITLPYEIYLNGSLIERFDERTIDPAPLSAPPGIVPQIRGGATTVAMSRTDAPVVPCTIGGHAVACLFDTGNSGLAMSAELAHALGVTPVTGGVIGSPGSPISGVAKAPALSVGAATYPSAQYVVVAGLHASGYDVVLGADAFANARVSLDFPKRAITIANANGAPSGGPSVMLEFQNFVPTAAVSLAGAQPLQLSVDTGDAAAVELASDYAAKHALEAGSETVGMGGAVAEHMRVETTKRLSAPDIGVVGTGFLQHFVASFDYAHGRLVLSPAT
jgi:hypothetical protein